MAIELATQYLEYVDEKFKYESKKSLLTNQDFNWTGAHTVKIYKISTAAMNDYVRNPDTSFEGPSRFGAIKDLDASTEELTLRKDRSFTFAIDKLDSEESKRNLAAATALSRQLREIVIPEVDTYVYGVMCTNAGTKPSALALTADNIYTEILKASETLDNAEVPETGRVIVVTPSTYLLMKQSSSIIMETDITAELRLKGVISMIDGAMVIKVPANRLPSGFGFMMAHPSATVAPTKLEDYRIHEDPPFISGSLVEGRICYDAFVLDNKKLAIYYQAQPTQTDSGDNDEETA